MNVDQRPSTSLSLLEMAKSGNGESWTRLTDLYGPIIYQKCLSKGLHQTDACDVTQEVFISIHKGLGNFKKNRPGDNFLGWVLTILARRIADFHRRQGKFEKAIGGSAGQIYVQTQAWESVDGLTETDKVKQQLVARALQLMKSDFKTNTWQAFYKTMVEGMTTDEACKELNMTPANIRQARGRVRKRLLEELGDVL